jgi:citrate synthase
MRDAGREPPSLDVGLVAITSALGLPPGSAAALFAVGRAAGWIAHTFEQREAGFMLRPRARYTGPAEGTDG